MLKILFVIDSLASGGKERRLTELLKGLKTRGDTDFELVVMSNDIHYKEILNLNINIHFIIRKTKRDTSVFSRLYKLCRSYNPQIVHCWESMTAIYTIPVCNILKIKSVNGMVIDTPVRRNIFNKNWLRARLTFPFSSMVVGNSIAGLVAYNAPKNKSICIYNGINMSRFTGLTDSIIMKEQIFGNKSDSIFVAGMVAGVDERKDYETLIDAAIILCNSYNNIRFLLVGDGSDLDRMKRKVPGSLTGKIVFLGKRSDVESIINLFDLGILLTNSKIHGEGISNSIIEYMAAGKPVIATSGGGTDEVVVNKVTGYLISPSDKQEFISKLELFLGDPELCKKMGSAGKSRIMSEFSIYKMVQNYIDLYKRLISN